MKVLVLFDFDGTLTRKDTMFQFLRYYAGNFKFIINMMILFPVLFIYKLKLIDNHRAKEIVLSFFFRNKEAKKIFDSGADFVKKVLPQLMKPLALQRMKWHISQGHHVYIVTASCDIWIKDWCRQSGVKLISTKLQIENGIFTGKLSGRNCNGKEKSIQIKENISLKEYSQIFAYGDSNGDKEMLDLATHPFFQTFG